MRYYIKAKRGTSDATAEIVHDSEVRILAKDSAELKTAGVSYTVSGTEMVAYLIDCCRNLEQSRVVKPLEDLKTDVRTKLEDIGTKLEDIGTKLNELSEIKTTISTEANNSRINDTTNTDNIKSGIDECAKQIEKVAGGMQNSFETISFTLNNGITYDILLSNISHIWTCPNESYIVTTGGNCIEVPGSVATRIKDAINKLKK